MDIIPKTQEHQSFLSQIIFVISITAFCISIGGYWTLLFLDSRQSKENDRLEVSLGSGKTQEEIALENDVFATKARLEDFASIIKARQDFLPLFVFLENVVHPDVVFQSMTIDKNKEKVQAKGVAGSFTTLEEQIGILKQRQELQQVLLSSMEPGQQGRVSFQVELKFSAGFFDEKHIVQKSQ